MTPDDVVIINATTPEEILKIDFFDYSKKTIICVGGILSWNTSTIVDYYKMMATIYLNSKNYNYIILFHDYYCSVQPLAPTCPHLIGKVFGPGIDKLVSLGLPAENLEFAGQSAGAHIVASVIENMVTPVKLLIGFDPGTGLTDFRRGLAQFTIALRSDSTNSGNINWNADLELIVNGGIRYQPGCEELES
ncbi:uncharacterized protein LOC123296990 isoform X2 [Chrysoperla carnea]|uniref:uncharacterized protein LOC123296990 isoform X2 n=1 Tax=Chrysoperla carnea TaxID=189513 RepID=UPI001D0685EA|nr:uncharacterized protein LOC123296990 isoform X2 [Chrysoperla carnea]